jgi:hypothetical protein
MEEGKKEFICKDCKSFLFRKYEVSHAGTVSKYNEKMCLVSKTVIGDVKMVACNKFESNE